MGKNNNRRRVKAKMELKTSEEKQKVMMNDPKTPIASISQGTKRTHSDSPISPVSPAINPQPIDYNY